MPRRVGVFLDVSNLYLSIKSQYKGRLNYRQYLDFLSDLGELQVVAYGSYYNEAEIKNFLNLLKSLGIESKFKQIKEIHTDEGTIRKADWDVGIAVDVMNRLDKLDTVVLGSADSDMLPLVQFIRSKGIDVITFACNISRELKENSTRFFEITPSMILKAGNKNNEHSETA